jgi:hypothetical protein
MKNINSISIAHVNVCTSVSMNLPFGQWNSTEFFMQIKMTEDGKKSAMSCCKGKSQLRNYGNFAFMTQIFAAYLLLAGQPAVFRQSPTICSLNRKKTKRKEKVVKRFLEIDFRGVVGMFYDQQMGPGDCETCKKRALVIDDSIPNSDRLEKHLKVSFF